MSEIVSKHFVTFYSPGTFVHETSTREIGSWDVAAACEMACIVVERHNATPFGFQFSTRSRGPNDLDSKQTAQSPMYYLGGTVLTLADVKARHDPKDHILIANMEGNGIARVVQNDNSWRTVQSLNEGDVVLDWTPPAKEVSSAS